MVDWLLAKASVRGTSHINSGLPCQDASIIRTDHSGKWLIAVASDGAGSAKRADEGANFVTGKFANALTELSKELEFQEPGSWTSDFVIKEVLEIRSHLRNQDGDENIQDFNCTLVACLLGSNGGFAIHIGDGAIIGQRQDPPSTHKTGSDNVNYVSVPENGEYVNETYFLTESDWTRHLRITPMPPLDWVLLCTDGGAALSMKNETEPKTGFLFPVLSKLIDTKNNHQRDSLLEDILNDPRADGVTKDDKTLAIAIRAKVSTEDILAKPELKETSKGEALEFADESLKADREVVLEAVRQDGWALGDSDESLQADREVGLEAVRQDGYVTVPVEDILAEPEPKETQKDYVTVPVAVTVIVFILLYLVSQSYPNWWTVDYQSWGSPHENSNTVDIPILDPEAGEQKGPGSSVEAFGPESAELAPTGNDETHIPNQGGQSKQKKTSNEKKVNSSNAVAGGPK